MHDEKFFAAAKLWGMVYGIRLKDDESAPSRATHALAVAMEHGAKTRTDYVEDIARYRASGRRTRMAAQLASCSVRIVPASYVDPIRCKDDSGRHSGLGMDPLETPAVQDFQQAWLGLERSAPRHARVLAIEYQRPDLHNREAKAKQAGLSVAQYKIDLTCAQFWVRSAFSLKQVLSDAEPRWPLTG